MLGMLCNMKSGTILLCEPSFIIHAWVKLFFFRNLSWWLMMNWNISSTFIWLWNKAMSWGFPWLKYVWIVLKSDVTWRKTRIQPDYINIIIFVSAFRFCHHQYQVLLSLHSGNVPAISWPGFVKGPPEISRTYRSYLSICGYSIVTLNYPKKVPGTQHMVGFLYAINRSWIDRYQDTQNPNKTDLE